MKASLYLFSEKNETRWDAGFTLSLSVTQWWLEEEGKRFQGLITPALPLYFAFFLLGKVKKGLNTGGDAAIEKVEGWIREAIQRIDRSLALNAKDLWEKSKGKPYSDGLKIWKREWLKKDGEVLRPLIEGRFWLLEQVEDYLDQVNRPLYGELAIRDQLLKKKKGGNGPADVEREERRAFRRRYLPMLIQYLYHRGELSLTSGMAIVESDRGPLLRCQRCSSEYRRWQGYPCGVCEHDDMVCEVCSAMGASKGCKPILFSPTRPKETAPSSFTLLPSFLAWEGELTPAQQEASQMAAQFVQGTLPRTDRRELLIWAVTGAGKTEVVFQAVDMALRQGKRVLLATPRKDVVLELTPRFRRAFPSVPMVSLYGAAAKKGRWGSW
ncbi:hypothetical protein CULT_410021 [[Clostridium] ultunense Esp]|nr:hypothetical protein CULT_410021 [[Clostridium] ultunense Esp]